MMRYILTYPLTLVIFAAIDAVWLTLMAPTYRATLGDILLDGFRPVPALLFYLMYLAGVMVFATAPAVRERTWRAALWRGGLFGLSAYGTYDLTNYASLKAWTLQLTVLDMIWGTFVPGTAATLGYAAAEAVLRRIGRG